MTYDPSIVPPGWAEQAGRTVTTYEDSELPRIAIAPPEFNPAIATMWVRSHHEPIMLRDGDGHRVLVFMATNNTAQIESQAFWRITDVHEAASRMRKWLDDKGLILPEDLQD